MNKKVMVFMGVFFLFGFLFAMYSFALFTGTGKATSTTQQGEIRTSPLSQAQVEKVAQTLVESEFIKDVPAKNPIALQFYTFDQIGRVWQNGFLIGENQLLSEGNPGIQVIMHSKYISEMNKGNLCEIIGKANRNGDLDFQSDSNKASLLIKYSSLLKYKGCL